MLVSLTVVPSYERDYKTKEEVLSDWKLGKDFTIRDISSPWNGKQCSCRDFTDEVIKIRYGTILGTGYILPNFVLIKNKEIIGYSE